MTFSQPSAGGDKFEPRDYFGKLLLVYPKSYNPAEQTTNGVTPAADVDVIVVDTIGPDGRPLFIHDARFFGNLAKSVRNDLGGQVLGRLGQGPNTRGTPPWILSNYTDADAALAMTLHQQYQQGLFKPAAENPMAQSAPARPAPGSGGGAGAPQQYGAPPASAPTPAYSPPTAQQWQKPATAAPPGPPAAPVAAPAPAGGVDPQLAVFLQQRGVQVTPQMTQQQAEAIAAAFPQ